MPPSQGKNTSLSDCLGQGRRHVPHREGQMVLTDIFQEQEFSVLKILFLQDRLKSDGKTLLICPASHIGMGEYTGRSLTL